MAYATTDEYLADRYRQPLPIRIATACGGYTVYSRARSRDGVLRALRNLGLVARRGHDGRIDARVVARHAPDQMVWQVWL